MEKRKLTAAPLYCRACGTRHYGGKGVPICRNRLCLAKDFTTAISTVAWATLLTLPLQRAFLTSLRIASD